MEPIFEELIKTIERNTTDNRAIIENVSLWAESWRKEMELSEQSRPETAEAESILSQIDPTSKLLNFPTEKEAEQPTPNGAEGMSAEEWAEKINYGQNPDETFCHPSLYEFAESYASSQVEAERAKVKELEIKLSLVKDEYLEAFRFYQKNQDKIMQHIK